MNVMCRILVLLSLCSNILYLQAQQPGIRTQSVLSEGDWYKLGCSASGIYRLSYQYISDLGINPSSIDPATIRIFGNGGGMLPQANAESRYDDLTENAIQVIGEEDGSFDPGDYILFYGEGPHVWNFDPESDILSHSLHLYSDTNFYFLNIGTALGKRIEDNVDHTNGNTTLQPARGARFHEAELDNPLGGSGRYWLGELFNIIRDRTFSFYIPDAATEGEIRIRIRVAARASQTTTFTASANGETLGTLNVIGTNLNEEEVDHYRFNTRQFAIPSSAITGDSLKITLSYNAGGESRAEGWLDFISIDYDLQPKPEEQSSRDFYMAPGTFVRINAPNADEVPVFWNITDPLNPSIQAVSIQGNHLELANSHEGAGHFYMLNEPFLTPVSERKIANQNLHGLALADYLLITHPLFRSAAERLAQFHRDHYQRSVHIVTPQQIFNEFSSGKLDVTAIRDFVRMFYLRSGGEKPGYVLLMGDGSYDPKNIRGLEETVNFVPTYQSRDSWTPPTSYTSDDFFVILDDDEGFWGENARIDGDNIKQTDFLDAAIGRLPVSTAQEARDLVDKIIDYVTNPEGQGDWRSRVVLVADYKPADYNLHHSQANNYTNLIVQENSCMHIDKIFMDNYELVPTASRPSFPEGRRALLNAMDEGSLIINYTGHGGESAWSDASIFTTTDVLKMKNEKRLPVVVTATCEFGRYDNPSLRSGAEEMLLRKNGGAIALLTTVRLVYAYQNSLLNQSFYKFVFDYNEEKGRMPTIGEVMVNTKNDAFPKPNTDLNSRNFTLLGDPGIIINYPKLQGQITHINDRPIDEFATDTLKSLSVVNVRGKVVDPVGEQMENFDGDMEVTVYDKPTRFEMRETAFSFYWQVNRVFDGQASVENGEFEFEFLVPIDISYDDGKGKMNLYFFNGEMDGAGCYNNLLLGGTHTQAEPDNEGPDIEMYLNDPSWIDGSKTGPAPVLYARVQDPSGINTVGGGIGHELIGILDEDESNIIMLNAYYTSDKNTFRSGTIEYPFDPLEPGPHTLRVRVWDGANNASESLLNFSVVENPQEALERVAAVPHPLTSETEFYIAHNQAGSRLEYTIEVYNTAGQLVRTLRDEEVAVGNFYQGMSWNGTDQNGSPLSNGIYIYQVTVRDIDTQAVARKVERVLIMR